MNNNFITQAVKTALGAILAVVIIFALLASQTVWARAEGPQSRQTERQVKAHEIAEAAREMGLPEDNPIIQEAKRIWHEEEEAKTRKMTYLGRYYVTGYDTCVRCCGKSDGITASGTAASVGRTVAMAELPFGTELYIEGIGNRIVEDRGPQGGVIDVLCNNHAECYALTGWYEVYVVEDAP